MSKGTLTLGAGVELKFTLGDPATVDDNLIRFDELLAPPNPAQLVTFYDEQHRSGDPRPRARQRSMSPRSCPEPRPRRHGGHQGLLDGHRQPAVGDCAQVGVAAGADVLEFLRFVVSATQVVGTLTDLKDNLEALYGAEIPYLSDTVTELVDLVTAFEDKVLDPLTGGANFELPSIQALVRNLSDRLGVAASSSASPTTRSSTSSPTGCSSPRPCSRLTRPWGPFPRPGRRPGRPGVPCGCQGQPRLSMPSSTRPRPPGHPG